MSAACPDPIPLDELVAYHLGELAPSDEATIEEHFFACDACARRLEAVARLGRAIVDVVRAGGVPSTVTRTLLERGAANGLRIRSYHLAPGAQVACTAAPEDDLVAVHLALDPAAAHHVDLQLESEDLDGGTRTKRTLTDVAVDATRNEVVFVLPGPDVRAFPRSHWTVHAILHEPTGKRHVGPYELDHTPWDRLPEATR